MRNREYMYRVKHWKILVLTFFVFTFAHPLIADMSLKKFIVQNWLLLKERGDLYNKGNETRGVMVVTYSVPGFVVPQTPRKQSLDSKNGKMYVMVSESEGKFLNFCREKNVFLKQALLCKVGIDRYGKSKVFQKILLKDVMFKTITLVRPPYWSLGYSDQQHIYQVEFTAREIKKPLEKTTHHIVWPEITDDWDSD